MYKEAALYSFEPLWTPLVSVAAVITMCQSAPGLELHCSKGGSDHQWNTGSHCC